MTLVKSNPLHASRRHAAVRTEEYLYNQLIPYIGNKRRLLPLITKAIRRTGLAHGVFVDFFAGSSVVARWAKLLGFQVIANDWEHYALEINRCFIELNHAPAFDNLGGTEAAFRLLNEVEPRDGYFAAHFCPADDERPDTARERMFYTRANGRKIDAMRELIASWEAENLINRHERSYLLAPFIFAISYTSNTSGVFKGFHNGWGGQTGTALYRILSDISLRQPVLFDNGCDNRAFRLDAQDLAEGLRSEKQIDIAYLDPPYNQHPYGSNYHILNTLALNDKPALNTDIREGNKSAIRKDWRTERRSPYNHAAAIDAYGKLIETIDARFILTSYSTDGNICLRDMLDCTAQRGAISCVFNPYKRYRVSSQRFSHKPMNVEFVLIIDTPQTGAACQVNEIYDSIMKAEDIALSKHDEAIVDRQMSLIW